MVKNVNIDFDLSLKKLSDIGVSEEMLYRISFDYNNVRNFVHTMCEYTDVDGDMPNEEREYIVSSINDAWERSQETL